MNAGPAGIVRVGGGEGANAAAAGALVRVMLTGAVDAARATIDGAGVADGARKSTPAAGGVGGGGGGDGGGGALASASDFATDTAGVIVADCASAGLGAGSARASDEGRESGRAPMRTTGMHRGYHGARKWPDVGTHSGSVSVTRSTPASRRT